MSQNMLGALVRALPAVPYERHGVLMDTIHKLSNEKDVEFVASLKALLRKQESAASILSDEPASADEGRGPRLPTYEETVSGWPGFCRELGLPSPAGLERQKDLWLAPQRGEAMTDAFSGRWFLYVPEGLTAHMAIEACQAQFRVFLKGPVGNFTLSGPVGGGYALSCAASISPDKEWLNRSSDTMRQSKKPFMDIRERCLLEAYYFWLTEKRSGAGRHLDLRGQRTRCPGSHDENGNIASAGHDGSRFCVETANLRSHTPNAGGRTVQRADP